MPTVFPCNGSAATPAAYASGEILDRHRFSRIVSDFINVFQANGNLDKLQVFNLLVLPGVTDNGISARPPRSASGKWRSS